MEPYLGVAAVTLLCGLLLFGMSLAVARVRKDSGIPAPAMTGDPRLERAVRAHYNTLEWVPIFLPSLWLFAVYWSPGWAAALGFAWLAGRVLYFLGYLAAAARRAPGFIIQAAAGGTLLFGALGRVLYLWLLG